MARIEAGTELSVSYTISDPTRRDYSFEFPVDSAQDVAVEYQSARLDANQIQVTLNAQRTGGIVRVLDATEVSDAVQLAAGGSLRILRDTFVERRTSFLGGGYALGAAVGVFSAHVFRILEELADRTESHADIILSDQQIRQLIADQLGAIDGADITAGTIPKTALVQALQTVLDQAVQATSGSISVNERAIRFLGADGTTFVEIETPGLTVEDGGVLGTTSTVETIEFADHLTAVRTGNKVTVTGADPGAAHSDADVTTLINTNPKVAAAEEFEEALRQTVAVITDLARMSRPSNNLPVALPGTAQTAAWTLPGTRMTWTVKEAGQPTVSRTFDVSDLLTHTGIPNLSTMMSAGNSLTLNSQDNSETFYLARRTDNNALAFGSTEVSTGYQVSISLDRIQATPFVDGPAFTQEQVQDWMAPALTGGAQSGITVVYDDSNNEFDFTVTGGGGTGSGETLEVRASLPEITGFSVGDVINVNGQLYELVASTDDSNLISGVSAVHSTNYYGQAGLFEWQAASPFNIHADLSKTALGVDAPASIYGEVRVGGYYAEVELSRSTGGDTTTTYRYARTPGEPALEAHTGAFSVRFFTDEDKATTLAVHGTVDRWELFDQGGRGVALPATATEAEAEAGTVTSLRSWSPERVREAVRALAPVAPAGTSAGSTVPTAPSEGDTFELLDDQTLAQDAVLTAGRQASFLGWNQNTGHLSVPLAGISVFGFYENEARNPAALRGRWAISDAGQAVQRTWTHASIDGTEYALTRLTAPYDHFFTLGGSPPAAVINQDYAVNARAGSVKASPDVAFTAPVYLRWDGARWARSSRLSAEDVRNLLLSLDRPWLPASVIQGGQALVQQRVHTGPIAGIAITNSSADVGGAAFHSFTGFQIVGRLRGEFHCRVEMNLHNPSVAGTGFGDRRTMTFLVTGTVFLSDLRSAANYDASNRTSGVRIGDRVRVHNADDTVDGYVEVRLEKDRLGNVAPIGYYDGVAGSATASVSLDVIVDFNPTDSIVPPVEYTSVANLPTSGLVIGERAIVRDRVLFVMEFYAVSSTRWLCLAGTSGNLFTGNIDISTARQYVSTGWTIDRRFPYLLINVGGHSSGGADDPEWRRISTADLLALQNATVGGTFTAANGLTLKTVRVITGSNQNERRTFLGKTSANVLLVSSEETDEDFYPFSVRGTG